MCAYIHLCPLSPSQGWDDLVSSAQPMCCSVSSHLACACCNSTNIKAKHTAVRWEDTHGRLEESAGGAAPAPTCPISRDKSLLAEPPHVSSAASGEEL